MPDHAGRNGGCRQHGVITTARSFVLLCAALAGAGTAYAQQRQLPAPVAPEPPCVEVRIGHDVAGRLSCLNQALRDEVGKVAPVVNGDPAAGLAPIQLGQPTPAALKQRLGNAYGRSSIPQRPPRNFPSAFAPVR